MINWKAVVIGFFIGTVYLMSKAINWEAVVIGFFTGIIVGTVYLMSKAIKPKTTKPQDHSKCCGHKERKK